MWKALCSQEQVEKRRLKRRLFRRSKHCHYCSCRLSLETATIDHKHPACKGGELTEQNAVLACFRCNVAKGSTPYNFFMRQIKGNSHQLQRLEATA
jgi:5-methylcytosine-specific restriction endonuclease McrA